MRGQVLTDGFDSGNKSPRKVTFFKLLGQGADETMPKLVADLLVDTAVA